MAHRFDRRNIPEERMEAANKGLQWHHQINRDLMKNDLTPMNNMKVAMDKAYDHSLIGTATYDKANEIRMQANKAKHVWNVKK
jgi:hypothetical protein